jgi:hypothetical protein
MSRLIAAAMTLALTALPASAQSVVPETAAYEFEVRDNLNSRGCHLLLSITHRPAGEAVKVSFLVTRNKTNGFLLNPAFAGFSVSAGDVSLEQRARISAAAFNAPGFASGDRFGSSTASDTGFAAGTIDGPTARVFLAALFRGGYEIAFTREAPAARRSYRIAEAPSAQQSAQFDACLVSLDG